jgi:hypothetical protein
MMQAASSGRDKNKRKGSSLENLEKQVLLETRNPEEKNGKKRRKKQDSV